jgi:hypothetical protein
LKHLFCILSFYIITPTSLVNENILPRQTDRNKFRRNAGTQYPDYRPQCNYVITQPTWCTLHFHYTLLMFNVSTCFGHYLPIFRRYYTNAELVTIYNCTQQSPILRSCSTSWGWASNARNMSRQWTSIKCSESDVCIKLVVLLRNYVTMMHGQQYIKGYNALARCNMTLVITTVRFLTALWTSNTYIYLKLYWAFCSWPYNCLRTRLSSKHLQN